MSVTNPTETVLGVLNLIDETRDKMFGTALASTPWRHTSPAAADESTALLHEPLSRCDDVTETLIVIVVAAMALVERERRPD